MTYIPGTNNDWSEISPADAGFNENLLNDAINLALNSETLWPYDLGAANNIPGLTDIDPEPWNRILGPLKPRGGPSGLLVYKGYIAAKWGDPTRVDMTFSIAKSYFSVLTGIAVQDGLIDSVDTPVATTLRDKPVSSYFRSDQNRGITWEHLLHQTSEWEGTLFDKPDQVDHFREVGPGSINTRKGSKRKLQKPGTFWEYNDVRVNLLGLALLSLFKRPLSDVLRERVMAPIGASDTWSWHGYENSWVDIDGEQMQSVPGGTHWGGGIQISTFDHARFGLLVHRRGVWGGQNLLPKGWCDALRSPCLIRNNYGYLWWLNTHGSHWPGLAENSYAALGAGVNIIWIAPDSDILIVARWVDGNKVSSVLKTFMNAID